MEKQAVPLDRLDVDWFLLLVKPPSHASTSWLVSAGTLRCEKTIVREIGLITRFIVVNDRTVHVPDCSVKARYSSRCAINRCDATH